MRTDRSLGSMHVRAAVCAAAVVMGMASSAGAVDYQVDVVGPAITDHLVLPEGPLPSVCRRAREMSMSGCRGEYSSLSFVVTALEPLADVRIEIDPVRGDGGSWPADAIDARVVKQLFRRSVGAGAALMPTLLVHDESFLGVEPAPTDAEPDRLTHVAPGPLRDADTLQPLSFSGRRQFWLTVQIPEQARPGDYTAALRVVPQNSNAAELTVSVHVYPFELLPPLIEYSIYYPAWLEAGRAEDHQYKFGDLSATQMLAEFRNMREHGLTNPNIYDSPKVLEDGSLDFGKLDRIIDMREQAGMRPRVLYLLGHPLPFRDRPLTPEERQRTRRYVREIDAWAEARGYDDVFYAANDEWWGERLSNERDSMLAVEEAGGSTFVAVMHTTFFERVGDALTRPVLQSSIGAQIEHAAKKYTPQQALRHAADLAKAGSFIPMLAAPNYRRAIDGMHRQGRKIFTYMNPIAGTPFPELHRRSTGLGMWRVGFDGTMTWAYTHITGDKVNQAMIFSMVYRTENDVLDTLHWEGFREGVNDVRYLTTLLDELGKAAGRFPGNPLVGETHAWLQTFDTAAGDLDAIRREMAERIVALQALGYRERTAEELLAEVDMSHTTVTAFPEPWRLRVDPDNVGVEQKWFDPATDISQWAPVRTDVDKGWDKQGFADRTVGYGWYCAALPTTEADLAREHKYLFFGAIDEDSWVYLNGELVFEHTFEKTGLVPSQIWLASFVVPLRDITLRGGDALAVRVLNTGGMGGVWKPVHLITSEQELSPEHLRAIVENHDPNATP